MRFLAAHGGDVFGAVRFLHAAGDVRADLIRAPRSTLSTTDILESVGWLKEYWGSRASVEISDAIRRILNGEMHAPVTPLESLTTAILGRNFKVGRPGNLPLYDELAESGSAPYQGLRQAVQFGARLILSEWLSQEYHQELFDDAAFTVYGLDSGFVRPFRDPNYPKGENDQSDAAV